MAPPLDREFVFLLLQFLKEERYEDTVHMLEKESGFFFNMKYFEDKIREGEWGAAEHYLSGFTKLNDNSYSTNVYFQLRKMKYLEALDVKDRAKAVHILTTDLKFFSSIDENLYKELAHLLTLENFRENEELSKVGDLKSARAAIAVGLKQLIEANPKIKDKLMFPSIPPERLLELMRHSFLWQHSQCKSPNPNPVAESMFTDHKCPELKTDLGKESNGHACSP